MNYNNRIFRGKSNTSNGEVSDRTLFHYHQNLDRIWADYSGGDIVTGHLQGTMFSDGSIEFLYHHENLDGDLMAGKCRSVPHKDSNGKLILKESWQWFTGDQTSGTSEVEEVYTES